MRFIYVMKTEDANKLIEMGYSLIKEDKQNHIWVFENRDVNTFVYDDELASAGVMFVASDILTF